MGMVVLRRFYPRHKYAAVALITLGIILSTMASQSVKSAERAAGQSSPAPEPPQQQQEGLDRSSPATLAIGVTLLTVALLLAARLGIFQEVLYRDYGRHSQQALFITVRGGGNEKEREIQIGRVCIMHCCSVIVSCY